MRKKKEVTLHSLGAAATDESDASESTTTESGKPTRKQVSKRDFLDSAGKVVDKIEEASGARYTLLAPSGNKDFDQQLGTAGKFETMCAIFGFHTKIGNVANTVLNDKDEPGTPDDAASAIEDFILKASDTAEPVWAERTTGGVGARIDKPALAASLLAVSESKHGAGKSPKSYADFLQKLEEDPVYVRSARQVPAVAQEYATRVGKPAKSIDDVLSF